MTNYDKKLISKNVVFLADFSENSGHFHLKYIYFLWKYNNFLVNYDSLICPKVDKKILIKFKYFLFKGKINLIFTFWKILDHSGKEKLETTVADCAD